MGNMCRQIPAAGSLEAIKREIERLNSEIEILFRRLRECEIRARENKYIAMGRFSELERDLAAKKAIIQRLKIVLRKMEEPDRPTLQCAIQRALGQIAEENAKNDSLMLEIDCAASLLLEPPQCSAFLQELAIKEAQAMKDIYHRIMLLLHPDAFSPGSAMAKAYAEDENLRADISGIKEKALRALVLGDKLTLDKQYAKALWIRENLRASGGDEPEEATRDSIGHLLKRRENLRKILNGLIQDTRAIEKNFYLKNNMRDKAIQEHLAGRYKELTDLRERHIRALLVLAEEKYGVSVRNGIELFLEEGSEIKI